MDYGDGGGGWLLPATQSSNTFEKWSETDSCGGGKSSRIKLSAMKRIGRMIRYIYKRQTEKKMRLVIDIYIYIYTYREAIRRRRVPQLSIYPAMRAHVIIYIITYTNNITRAEISMHFTLFSKAFCTMLVCSNRHKLVSCTFESQCQHLLCILFAFILTVFGFWVFNMYWCG